MHRNSRYNLNKFACFLKTHFKFLFNSSKISTSSAHVIFFLNTRLHYDSTKIRITRFGSTHKEIQNSQNNIKIRTNALAFHSIDADSWGPPANRARMSVTPEQRRRLCAMLLGATSPTARILARPRSPACSTHLCASIGVGDGRAEPPEVAHRRSWRHGGGARWCAGHLQLVEVWLGLIQALGYSGEREGRERR